MHTNIHTHITHALILISPTHVPHAYTLTHTHALIQTHTLTSGPYTLLHTHSAVPATMTGARPTALVAIVTATTLRVAAPTTTIAGEVEEVVPPRIHPIVMGRPFHHNPPSCFDETHTHTHTHTHTRNSAWNMQTNVEDIVTIRSKAPIETNTLTHNTFEPFFLLRILRE
jgi:hypothetical protein